MRNARAHRDHAQQCLTHLVHRKTLSVSRSSPRYRGQRRPRQVFLVIWRIWSSAANASSPLPSMTTCTWGVRGVARQAGSSSARILSGRHLAAALRGRPGTSPRIRPMPPIRSQSLAHSAQIFRAFLAGVLVVRRLDQHEMRRGPAHLGARPSSAGNAPVSTCLPPVSRQWFHRGWRGRSL